MTEWTTSAREELECYLNRVRGQLQAAEADPAEVLEDLRRHVDEEVRRAGVKVVTREEVQRILVRLGDPGIETRPEIPPPVLPSDRPVQPQRELGSRHYWLGFFGVLLPAFTIGLEFATGLCAGAFFDPIPSAFHLMLVGLVPAANLLLWLVLNQKWVPKNRGWLGWLHGAAVGVALFYSFLFLPLTPVGLVAVLYLGFGLLPLAPVVSLFCALRLGWWYRRQDGVTPLVRLTGLWRGMALGILALVMVEAPVWMTRMAAHKVAEGLSTGTLEDLSGTASQVRYLRRFGDESLLLRLCYGRTRGAQNMDVVGWVLGVRDIGTEDARKVYYRVTGRPFNSVPAPKVRMGRGRFTALDDWTWDNDQAGAQVGGRVRNLFLVGSRLDSVVEADAAVGYTEWTLEFRNDSEVQREARAQLLLPKGGVVSRLTLWVNGEEREAAFAGRAEVREAYEKVVRQRQDPVLVTTVGPDEVLMQCFPVPRQGGVMKVRLGISFPVQLDQAGMGRFRWPTFVERNFTIPESFRHSVWVESARPLKGSSATWLSEEPKPGKFVLRGESRETEMAQSTAAVHVQRDTDRQTAWAQDPRSPTPQWIRQTLWPEATQVPRTLVLVVDTSAAMADSLQELAAAMTNFPSGMAIHLVEASDQIRHTPGLTPGEVGQRLARLKCEGGQDNLHALLTGWDLASTNPGSALLWVHAPQPVIVGSIDFLNQRLQRRTDGPAVLDLQVTPGPNRIAEASGGMSSFQRLERFAALSTDLAFLASAWSPGGKSWVVSREAGHSPQSPRPSSEIEASFHLVRLWANEEAVRLLARRQVSQSVGVGARYQLVTPVTGAVVLETARQFEESGLTPADPATVPAIPEPRTLALGILTMGLFFLGRLIRRRRSA